MHDETALSVDHRPGGQADVEEAPPVDVHPPPPPGHVARRWGTSHVPGSRRAFQTVPPSSLPLSATVFDRRPPARRAPASGARRRRAGAADGRAVARHGTAEGLRHGPSPVAARARTGAGHALRHRRPSRRVAAPTVPRGPAGRGGGRGLRPRSTGRRVAGLVRRVAGLVQCLPGS